MLTDHERQADLEAEQARMGALDVPTASITHEYTVMNPMTDTKHPLASKGIWGGIVALVALIAGALGYVITPEEQEALVLAVSSLATVAGVILGIVGRWRAKTVIG